MGKNPWIELLASWGSVQLPAKGQNSSAEIGLIRKRTTCRMHGGRSRGPRTQAGKERARRAVIKHEEYTKADEAKYKVMDLIKASKDMLNRF